MSLASAIPPTPINGAGVAGTFIIPMLLRLWGFAPALLLIIGIIGGLMGIVWYSIMIGESNTFKSWRARRASARADKTARKKLIRINALKAEERAIMAELAQLEPTPMVKMAEAAGSAPTVPRGSDLRTPEHANTESGGPHD